MVSTGGINTSLRDYAHFGMLIANHGKVNDVQVLPEAVIKSLTSGGDRASWKKGEYANMIPLVNSYRSYWYQTENKNHGIFAMGIYGQHTYVDPTNNVVIVQMSSLPEQIDDGLEMPILNIMPQIADMVAKS